MTEGLRRLDPNSARFQSFRPEKQPYKEQERNGTLAWVLSPGFLKGWLEFGVMDRLNKIGLYPDMVVGSSIGAYVGFVAPATRTSIEDVEIFQQEYDTRVCMDKSYYNRGIFSSDHAIALLKKRFPQYKSFEDLPVPFYVVATRKKDYEPVVFSSGPVLAAVKASIAHPISFPPEEIDGEEYIDGGISNPAPLDVARANGATHIIFIDAYTNKFNGTTHHTQPLQSSIQRILQALPNDERKYVGKAYAVAKGLLVAKPTLQESLKWFVALQNQLIRKSVELHTPNIHINLSHALDGDVDVPISNSSFQNGSAFIEKGRRATDMYVSQLLDLKHQLSTQPPIRSGKLPSPTFAS